MRQAWMESYEYQSKLMVYVARLTINEIYASVKKGGTSERSVSQPHLHLKCREGSWRSQMGRAEEDSLVPFLFCPGFSFSYAG